jgi:hypothetical protein
MNAKREKATRKILMLIKDLDSTNMNYLMWKERLENMNDKEFDTWMKQIYENPKKYHLFIDTAVKNDDNISYDNIKAIADKYGVKLFEYCFFPHQNPDDPEHPFITATPVPIIFVHVRKLYQMLDRKQTSVSNIDEVNSFTGQVVNGSKAASISDTQTAALTTTGQQNAIREFLTIRADNERGKLKMLAKIEQEGEVNYNDLSVNINDNQSYTFLKVMMRGAGFKMEI